MTDSLTSTASKSAPTRSPDEIEAEIAAVRERLSGTLDQISDRVKPSNVAKRQMERARAVVQEPDGTWKPKPVAIIAGVALLLVVYGIRRARLR